jgi:hypothetical protein
MWWLSSPLLGQGHWLSLLGGGSTSHYFTSSNAVYHAKPSPDLGVRYGRDLGPKFRFGLGFTHERRKFDQVNTYLISPTETVEKRSEFVIREWTVSILLAKRVAYSERSDTRALFGFDLVRPSHAHAKLALPYDDRFKEFDFDAPPALGLRLGLRHAVKLSNMLWLFGELHVAHAVFSNDAVSVPGSREDLYLGSMRSSVLVCVGIELGRSEVAKNVQ